MSGPTHRDMEQGDTSSATTISSPPVDQAPSQPPSEPAIPDTPIIIETIIPHQNPHPLESDRVASTTGEEQGTTLKDNIEQTITKSNPAAQDHYADHGDNHEARTTDRISDGASEEITPHLGTSFSPEVYHPLLF